MGRQGWLDARSDAEDLSVEEIEIRRAVEERNWAGSFNARVLEGRTMQGTPELAGPGGPT